MISTFLARTAIWMFPLMFLTSPSIFANVFDVDLTDASKKPQITVHVKDKDGFDRILKAFIDTGNSDGIYVNTTTATALGLTVGTDVKVRGAGGDTTLKNTEFKDAKALQVQNVKAPDAQTQKTLSITGRGIIGANMPNNTLLLGQDFLSQYVYTINPKTSKLTLTALDQLEKKPDVQPKAAPATKKADTRGSLNRDDDLAAPSWTVPLVLDSIPGEFVIGTGTEMSLISEAYAASLGLDLSRLPLDLVPTIFGDVNVWTTPLSYVLFSEDGSLLNTFGILPNSFNPDNINILGTDILGNTETYQVDTDKGFLRAGAVVPEPVSSVLFLLGLLLAPLCHKRS